VRYRGRFYGTRDEDLAKLGDRELARLPSAAEIAPLKQRLAVLASGLGRMKQAFSRVAHRLGA